MDVPNGNERRPTVARP